MKIKRISCLVILCLCVFLVSGCEGKNKVHEHCTRGGNLEGANVSLEYDIYYTGDRLNRLVSNEKIISTDKSILDTYEKSFKDINKDYENLKYYDVKVTRTDDSVLSYSDIDFDRVDVNYLIDLEGEDGNIYENGIANVTKWKKFAKKFGTKCEEVK